MKINTLCVFRMRLVTIKGRRAHGTPLRTKEGRRKSLGRKVTDGATTNVDARRDKRPKETPKTHWQV